MKKQRLLALLSMMLFCAGCTANPPAEEPTPSTTSVAETSESSASTPEQTAEESSAETQPSTPANTFTPDPVLAEELADDPGLVYLYGAPNGNPRGFILSKDGYFAVPEDESGAPLYDNLSSSSAQYYTLSRQIETGETEMAVFNRTGACVSDYDQSQILLLAGDILVRGSYEIQGTDGPTYTTGVTFTDLTTGETLWEPGRCQVYVVDGEHLAVTLQLTEDAEPDLQIVRADDLSVVKEIKGETGVAGYWMYEPVPKGCVVLSDGFYSLPLDQTFTGIERFCGEGALLENENGGYDLIRLSDGETVEKGTSRQYSYWSEPLSCWTDSEGQGYCYAPAAYGEEPMQMQTAGGYIWTTGSDYYALKQMDDTLDVLRSDGSLLYSIKPNGENLPYYDAGGWSYMNTGSGGVTYYGPQGQEITLEGYGASALWSIALGEDFIRFAAVRDDGKTVLLDETGKELASGLSSLYALTLPGEDSPSYFQAATEDSAGLMDLDGSWIWQGKANPPENVFIPRS